MKGNLQWNRFGNDQLFPLIRLWVVVVRLHALTLILAQNPPQQNNFAWTFHPKVWYPTPSCERVLCTMWLRFWGPPSAKQPITKCKFLAKSQTKQLNFRSQKLQYHLGHLFGYHKGLQFTLHPILVFVCTFEYSLLNVISPFWLLHCCQSIVSKVLLQSSSSGRQQDLCWCTKCDIKETF